MADSLPAPSALWMSWALKVPSKMIRNLSKDLIRNFHDDSNGVIKSWKVGSKQLRLVTTHFVVVVAVAVVVVVVGTKKRGPGGGGSQSCLLPRGWHWGQRRWERGQSFAGWKERSGRYPQKEDQRPRLGLELSKDNR